MADRSRTKSTVFVGGLDNRVTQNLLHEAFLPFGEIIDVTLPKPDQPGSTDPHRGFGYVEFEDEEDAKEAMYNMDQSEIFGRVIKVAPSKPQKDANEGLGSKTAIWEQVRLQEAPIRIFEPSLTYVQEGYLAHNAAGEEDGAAQKTVDPMQGLEGLDVAGPKE